MASLSTLLAPIMTPVKAKSPYLVTLSQYIGPKITFGQFAPHFCHIERFIRAKPQIVNHICGLGKETIDHAGHDWQ